jgi:hypothetical protein
MKSILGTLTLGLFLSLAWGALSLYQVSRDKAVAPNQATASASVNHMGNSHANGRSRCIYTFDVDGNPYGGHGCPANSAASSAIEEAEEMVGARPETTATVYYDPNDPSYNSLVDFSVKADNDSMKARFAFGLAAGCVLLLVIGVVIAARASQPGGGDGGIMVDAQGTMLYPDQIKSDPDDERFSAHPTHISAVDE